MKKILGFCESDSCLEKVQARVTCDKFDPLLFLSKDPVMQLQCIWANVSSWHGKVYVAGRGQRTCAGAVLEEVQPLRRIYWRNLSKTVSHGGDLTLKQENSVKSKKQQR